MILPEFDNVLAGDHMTAEFGIYDAANGGWMPMAEYIERQKYWTEYRKKLLKNLDEIIEFYKCQQ